MLLAEIHLPIENVEEAVIAGAFGYHINSQSILDISLIPKGFKGKITFVGNSSVEGARIALINKSMLDNMVALKDEITVLELSTKEKFQEYFRKRVKFLSRGVIVIKVDVISGFLGSGKTTLIRKLLKAYENENVSSNRK